MVREVEGQEWIRDPLTLKAERFHTIRVTFRRNFLSRYSICFYLSKCHPNLIYIRKDEEIRQMYSLVKINCNAGQQNAILPLCSLFTSYSSTVGTQYFMWAPLAPSKLFNCFTIAVYCR